MSAFDPELTGRRDVWAGQIQQLTTTEIFDCEHDALEMVPPDHGQEADVGLEQRRHEMEQHRQSIVAVEGRPRSAKSLDPNQPQGV